MNWLNIVSSRASDCLFLNGLKREKANLVNINMKQLLDEQAKIKRLQSFFFLENQQVDTILALSIMFKGKNPLGMTYPEILEQIHNEHRYFLYKNNAYLRSILNTLTLPPVGLLELSESTAKFNLTKLGLNYYYAGELK